MNWDNYQASKEAIETCWDTIDELVISVAEVAIEANTCRRTVQRWCDEGKLMSMQRDGTGIWYIFRKDWEGKKDALKEVGHRRRRGRF